MEYVDGISLRAIMRDERPLPHRAGAGLSPARSATRWSTCTAQGVVHRDLKPENVLVTADGKLKIMDFGIALDESARRLTWSGLSTTIGTPDYMAPEQVSGRRGDARTDIYALGTILYEMLTGELPFAGAQRLRDDEGEGQRGSAAAEPLRARPRSASRGNHPARDRALARATATRAPPRCSRTCKDPAQRANHRARAPRCIRRACVRGACGARSGSRLFFGSLVAIFVVLDLACEPLPGRAAGDRPIIP